jgi:predicted MPP superfamily phosphohydrolase
MSFIASILINAGALWVFYLWTTSAFPWIERRRRGLAVAIALLWTEQIVSGWIVMRWHSGFAEQVHTTGSVLLIAMGFAAGPIMVLRLASWIVGHARRNSPASASDVGPVMTRRQIAEGGGGLAVLGVSGAVLGWGAFRGRHMFELREVPVRIPGLPRALDGYTIAQISDLHMGPHLAERDLYAGLSLVRRARPDLVVVTGDIVDLDPNYTPFIARTLADLPARDGVAAILGNHDHYSGAGAVSDGLRSAGVDVLVNQGRLLRAKDGGGFALLGVDDRWSSRYGGAGARLDLALSMVPPDAPRILLSHQPPTVDLWAGQVALQLSGHTHGGQINPGFRPADLFFRYVAGSYAVRGTTLYVNRGFGTVGPPSRVGAPPEVTRIVLVAA